MALRNRRASRSLTGTASLLLTLGLLTACSDSGGGDGEEPSPSAASPAPSGSPSTPSATSPSAEPSGSKVPRVGTPTVAGTIATGLQVPWGLAFLPGGDALVAERDSGEIKRVTPDGKVTPVGEVQGVRAAGEGGLLGLAVSPRFASDAAVFAYFTAGSENRIARLTYRDDRIGGQHTIVSGIPSGGVHNGGRLLFGPDGQLYAGTGESGDRPLSQDLGSLGGKILRMTPDGKPSPGNPFPNSLVYSYGHRNVQGLAFDSAGRLWASEFGQNTWDELNLIRPGRNYGWPAVEGRAGDDRYVDPVAQWHTDEASPSGIAIAGEAVYMATLKGSRLWRIPLDGDRAGTPTAFFTDQFGRLRTVQLAPDGSLWLTTSNTDGRGDPREGDDRILRIALR